MKKIIILSLFIWSSIKGYSQHDSTTVEDNNTYRFIKTDGGDLIGKILNQDAREILMQTRDGREFYIPQHMVKKLVVLDPSDFSRHGDYIGEDNFATRYFISTNGLPIKRGKHYISWNWFGPDVQLGVGENLGIGFITTWLGVPIIASVKRSWKIKENIQVAVGGLIGTAVWANPDYWGALPFGTLSFGDRSKNIAISAGYGGIWDDQNFNGRTICSIAGMLKVSQKVSLIFDSFILLPSLKNASDNDNNRRRGGILLIPGIRLHKDENKAFQIGFSGILDSQKRRSPVVPMLQWNRTF